MKGRQILYSDTQLAWIEARKADPRKQLHAAFVAQFGRSDVSFPNFKALCTRKGWSTGRTGCFVKGQVSHNKGKAFPSRGRSAENHFKTGGLPHNYRGPGHERINKEDGYVTLIVAETNPHTGADTRPVLKHRWMWEQAHGPLPADHALKCMDGDKTNCDPTNWKPIPRALLPRLGGRYGRAFDSAPPEIKPALLATARLEHAARELRKGAK